MVLGIFIGRRKRDVKKLMTALKKHNEKEIARLIFSGTSFTTIYKGISALELAKLLTIDLQELLHRHSISYSHLYPSITKQDRDKIILEVKYAMQLIENISIPKETISSSHNTLHHIKATPIHPHEQSITK